MIALLIETFTKTAIIACNDMTCSTVNLDISLEFCVIGWSDRVSLKGMMNREVLIKDSMYKRVM